MTSLPPLTTSTVIEPWSVSPASLIENVPSTLSVTVVPNRFFATLARVPSEAAMAFRTT